MTISRYKFVLKTKQVVCLVCVEAITLDETDPGFFS